MCEGAHAVLTNLKAQNSVLHVTTERLVDTNSEIMARLNKQSDQVTALQEALANAQASQPPQKDMQQQDPSTLTACLHITTKEMLVQDLHGMLTSLVGMASSGMMCLKRCKCDRSSQMILRDCKRPQ